jgi:hypothetical protein
MFLLDVGNVSGSGSQKAVNGPAKGEPTKRVEVAQEKKAADPIDAINNDLKTFIEDFKKNPKSMFFGDDLLLRGLSIPEVGDSVPKEFREPLKAIIKQGKEIEAEVLADVNSRFESIPKEKRHKVGNKDFAAVKEGEPGSKSKPLEPTNSDFISKGGDKDPWENHFKLDGKTYPLTILQAGRTNKNGIPEVLHLQDGMELDSKSVKEVWFKNPKTGTVEKGVYFEVVETFNGKEARNGVIAPANTFPVVVVRDTQLTDENKKTSFDADPASAKKEGYYKTKWDTTKEYFKPQEAWYLGVDEANKQIPVIPNFTEKKIGTG